MPNPTGAMDDWIREVSGGRFDPDFDPARPAKSPPAEQAVAGFLATPDPAAGVYAEEFAASPMAAPAAGLTVPELATAGVAAAGIAGLVAGPVMEFQQAALQARERDRATAFRDAFRELVQLYPDNQLARDFVTVPGWIPSETDVAKLQATLSRAKARAPAALSQDRSKLTFQDWDANTEAQRKPDDGAAPSEPRIGTAIVTRTREEADLAATLRAQGWGARQIETQIDNLRNRSGTPAAPSDGRNKGLPEALWTDSKRARDIAIRNDPKLRAAIASGQVSADDVVAHHCLAMQALRDNPEIAAALARTGWSPDNTDNLIALARDADAQARMSAAMGETRGIHDSGHPQWNLASGTEISTLIQTLRLQRLTRGSPQYDAAVRRGVKAIERRLRQRTPKDRLTMLDQPRRTG